jgi:hypothetical protein
VESTRFGLPISCKDLCCGLYQSPLSWKMSNTTCAQGRYVLFQSVLQLQVPLGNTPGRVKDKLPFLPAPAHARLQIRMVHHNCPVKRSCNTQVAHPQGSTIQYQQRRTVTALCRPPNKTLHTYPALLKLSTLALICVGRSGGAASCSRPSDRGC